MKRALQALALLHRWLGAALCIPFAVWFLSGIVLVFVGFPGLSAGERLARAPALDPERIVTPLPEAAQGLGFSPERVSLNMLADTPAWRFESGAELAVVSAEDGRRISPLDEAMALRVAAVFLGHSPDAVLRSERLDEPDQWTPHARPNGQLPLLRVEAGDEAGTRVYVSLPRARIIQLTSTRSRFWAWLGAIPHWWYPIALRQHAVAWRGVVLVGAGAGSAVCALGLAIGILRLRRRARAPASRRWSPFADAWLRWHHLLGLFFGVFALSWVWSGMLSLNPVGWSSGSLPSDDESSAFRGAPVALRAIELDARSAAELCAGQLVVKSLELVQLTSHPYWFCASEWDSSRLLDATDRAAQPQTGLPLAALSAAARAAVPGELLDTAVIGEADDYVYPTHLDPEVRFPLVRFQFANGTWLYADPQAGRLLRRYDESGRAERWLYAGLHRLDFAALYQRRSLWACTVVLLCAAGTGFSLTGVVSAARWLRQKYAGARS